MFDVYIFDLDGTLIDIKDILWFRKIQRKVFEEFDVFLPPEDDLYTPLKLPLPESDEYMKKIGIPDPREYWCRLEEVDREERARLLDDGFLNAYPDSCTIKELDGKKALVSNTPESVAELELERVGLLPHFDGIFATRYKEASSKPEPDGILEALELFNVAPERAIMIGDSELDVMAGKKAGVRTAQIVREHFHNYERTKPTFFIHSLKELFTITP